MTVPVKKRVGGKFHSAFKPLLLELHRCVIYLCVTVLLLLIFVGKCVFVCL